MISSPNFIIMGGFGTFWTFWAEPVPNPCRTRAEPMPNPVFFAWYERHCQRSIDDVDIMWYHVQQVVEKLCRTLHDEPLCRTLCRTLFFMFFWHDMDHIPKELWYMLKSCDIMVKIQYQGDCQIWSSVHMVIWSSGQYGHLVILSSDHLVIFSILCSGHLVNVVIWSSGQLIFIMVIWSSGLLVICSSGHRVLWSSGHLISWL